MGAFHAMQDTKTGPQMKKKLAPHIFLTLWHVHDILGGEILAQKLQELFKINIHTEGQTTERSRTGKHVRYSMSHKIVITTTPQMLHLICYS